MKNSSIYITDNFIRVGQAALTPKKQASIKEWELSIALLKKEEIPRALKTFIKENKIIPEYLILGMPRTKVTVKYLTLPTLNDKEINQMIELKLDNLFPYKPEELTYDYSITHKGTDGSRVMLVAALKEAILSQVSTLRLAGLIPDAINISTISLFNQFYAQKRPPNNYLLINFDDSFMEMILISEGRLNFSRGIKLRNPPETREVIKIVGQNITILRDKGNLIHNIIISGRGMDLKDFAKHLEESLPYKTEVNDSFSVLKGLTAKINGNPLSINLLPGELKIQKRNINRKRTLILFSTLVLLNLSLVANIFFYRVKVRQEYSYLLKSGIQKISLQTSELQEKMTKVGMLKEYMNSGRLTLGLMTELYRVSPEGISLSTLNISHQKSLGSMILTGQAKDSETIFKFADALKKSVLIKNANVHNITQVKSEATEKIINFEIRANF